MSDVLQLLNLPDGSGAARRFREPVAAIDFAGGEVPPIVMLGDGQSSRSTCIGCYDTPCARKDPTELSLPEPIASFPGNPSLDVCPVQAISWDSAHSVVNIDESECIGCGLCVARCPYGALYLTRDAKAVVLTQGSELVQEKRSAAAHVQPAKKGVIAPESNAAIRAMPAALLTLADGRAAIFVRNAFCEIGSPCRSRRRGDTNMRIDAVAAFRDGHLAVIEIELSNAAVESPRALLEDLAILHSRYGVELGSIYPISVVGTLPNGRSDYYRVIDDIRAVLNLDCRTITIASLLLLLWSFASVSTLDGLFTTTSSAPDLTESLTRLVPRLTGISEPSPGAWRPAK
jgi:ferredoxin